MTANEFAYWLNGFAELSGAPPNAEQWQSIRDHLALVFTKVTPQVGPARDLFARPQPIQFDYVQYVPPTALPATPLGPTTTTC